MSYKQNNLETMSTVKNNINISISRRENNFNLHESYLEITIMDADVANAVIAIDDNVMLVNYGVIWFY